MTFGLGHFASTLSLQSMGLHKAYLASLNRMVSSRSFRLQLHCTLIDIFQPHHSVLILPDSLLVLLARRLLGTDAAEVKWTTSEALLLAKSLLINDKRGSVFQIST